MSPSMLQSCIPPLAADLAEKLCSLTGGRVGKVCFGSSGSEGVESAMKFARAHTKRDWILFGEGGFHGLTMGALSLMSNPWWKEGFGNLLTETKGIPFGDLYSLRRELATERYACIILEPVQGESGVVVPSKEYLQEASRLCDKHGTLLVIDEVQTGIYRTGKFLASHHFEIAPDMVILAKALSGGHVPVGALLMRDDICRSVYSSLDKSFVHASTFGENRLAMTAGLATLEAAALENVEDRCIKSGELLRSELNKRLEKYEIIAEVRGLGLMNGIVFKTPESLALKMFHKSFAQMHPGLFGQMVVSTLFNCEHILCQMAGNNYYVIKSMPALTIDNQLLMQYIDSIERVCDMIVNEKTKFWVNGLQMATKALAAKIRK